MRRMLVLTRMYSYTFRAKRRFGLEASNSDPSSVHLPLSNPEASFHTH